MSELCEGFAGSARARRCRDCGASRIPHVSAKKHAVVEPTFDIECNPEKRLEWQSGEWIDVVAFKYRKQGSKGRWTRFVVVPDEGQTFADIIHIRAEIVEQHASCEERPTAVRT